MSFTPNRIALAGVSPTLASNELVRQLRADGRRILHMGFGESPFPAPKRLVDALREHAHEKSYLPVTGLPELCQAVADHHALHAGVDMDAFDVLIGPGSKLILFALQMAIPGDLLLPTPSWVSYRPQARLLGQRVLPVPTDVSDRGYSIDAAAIDQAIVEARAANLNPTKLLINFPNNPTGLTIDDGVLSSLVEVCRRRNLTLISDEIYGRLAYNHSYRSAAAHFPEGAVVTTGLSKHLSLGGWRLGVCLVPKGIAGLFESLCHIASETWSCVTTPIQIAAIDAYAGHADVETFIRDTTDIHSFVNSYIAQQLNVLGIECPLPQGGFYTWPDFSDALSNSYPSSDQLVRALLEKHGLATLPGTVFGEKPDTLKLRLSGCDYDGEKALGLWQASAGIGAIPNQIERIAPNVVSALQALESVVEEHQAI